MASSEPHAESLKLKAVCTRFGDELLAAIISLDEFGIQDMQSYIAEYRGWCKDLEEEENAIREDKTRCVVERKRHCEQIEPRDPTDTVACSTTPELCCSTNSNGSIDALRPKPGEVYCAYHEQSQRHLAAAILPLTDLGSIGILGTMETLGFSKSVPNCVAFNVNAGRLEWRDGYGDGEPFPENEAAGWVSAGDLRMLDEENPRASDVPFHWAIRAYLERRTLSQTLKERQYDPDTSVNQDSPANEKRNTKKARVQKEVQVVPQLATPDPEPELQSSMVSPSNMNSSSDQRDHDGELTAESDVSPRDPDIIAQSIDDFLQESQDEVSYFSSAENSEKTYQILSALIDGDAVLGD
ncbi:hypothetical protein FMUND_9395 [Fusarium mundagurra]|uniref:Uncharacterized protein n=1 Tax=Fusarium mundagurra TaxID=1567541 RepID=A0A8H5YG24_9HYPO|nr:hypothetical protein FMUND_9395 [Fusarium mundagurra]